MANFTGRFEVYVDNKGRFAIPYRLRRQMRPEDDDTFMVCPGLDGGLMALPKSTWLAIREDIGLVNPFNQDQRTFLRRFAHEFDECRLDTQGRIMLPPFLKDKSGINGKAVVAGSLDWIEIFEPGAYAEIRRLGDEKAAEIANRITISPRPHAREG